MTIVSSHTLNSVNGTHAAGVVATLYKIGPNNARIQIFETRTDESGRFSEAVDTVDPQSGYELVFATGDYFASQSLPPPDMKIVAEVVIRFEMPDPTARYHMPVMIAPNSYSVWWPG